MRADKQLAIKLRMQGHSYAEIRNKLGVSKGTLSGWLGAVLISPAAQARINRRTNERSLAGLLKRNINQTKLARERAARCRTEAAREVGLLSDRELMLVGAALYWAEGYKRPLYRNGKEATYHAVSMTNADPKLILIFLEFMERCCGTDRKEAKASLRLFEHINEEKAIEFWSAATGISKENFQRSYYGISISSSRKKPFDRLPYGVIQVRIGGTRLFHKIMGWIEGLKMPR